VSAASFEETVYGAQVVGVVEPARNAHRIGQVVVSDPEYVQAFDGGDLIDVVDASPGFDLDDQERLVVGVPHPRDRILRCLVIALLPAETPTSPPTPR